MTVRTHLNFDPAYDALNGRGWQLTWYDDANGASVANPTIERFFRLSAIGAPSATRNITNLVLTSNVVTITTSAAHGFVVGDTVDVQLDSAFTFPQFVGTYTVTAVPSTTTFSYAKVSNNVASTPATGLAVSQPSVIERIRAIYQAAPDIVAYFTTKAQAAVVAAHPSEVTTDLAAYLAAEGL